MKLVSFIIIFMGVNNFLYAQEITKQEEYVLTQINQLNQNDKSILTNESLKNATNINYNSTINSTIYFNQTGEANSLSIKSNLNDSQLINQIGNQNNYTFINYFNSNPSNMSILQQGNNNFLQIYGQNSIIKNLKIVQKSNAKTLIIRNY